MTAMNITALWFLLALAATRDPPPAIRQPESTNNVVRVLAHEDRGGNRRSAVVHVISSDGRITTSGIPDISDALEQRGTMGVAAHLMASPDGRKVLLQTGGELIVHSFDTESSTRMTFSGRVRFCAPDTLWARRGDGASLILPAANLHAGIVLSLAVKSLVSASDTFLALTEDNRLIRGRLDWNTRQVAETRDLGSVPGATALAFLHDGAIVAVEFDDRIELRHTETADLAGTTVAGVFSRIDASSNTGIALVRGRDIHWIEVTSSATIARDLNLKHNRPLGAAIEGNRMLLMTARRDASSVGYVRYRALSLNSGKTSKDLPLTSGTWVSLLPAKLGEDPAVRRHLPHAP